MLRALYNPLKVFILLFLITLLTHGLTFLNTGVFWDDWVLWFFNRIPNGHQMMLDFFSKTGVIVPVSISLKNFFNQFHSPLIYPINNFICIIVSGFSLYLILKTMNLPKYCAPVCAVMFIITPSSTVGSFAINSQYEVGLMLSAVAAAISIYNQKNKLLLLHVIFRILSWALFIYAFPCLNSLYEFYGIFYLLLYIKQFNNKKNCVINHLKNWLTTLDYFILPFIMYAIKLTYKKSGIYGNYNDITISHKVIFYARDYIVHGILPTIIIIFLCYFITKLILKNRLKEQFPIIKKPSKILWISIIVFIAAILPYIIVNKHPEGGMLFSHGIYQTRHMILLPYGFSIFLLYFCLKFLTTQQGTLTKIGKTTLLGFIAISFIYWNSIYLSFEALNATQNSVILQLKENPSWKNYTFYIVKNSFPVGYFNPKFRYYSYAGMLEKAYGGFNRVGLQDYGFRYSVYRFRNFKRNKSLHNIGININYRGKWAQMTISKGSLTSNKKASLIAPLVGAQYLYYKILAPNKMNKFLKGILTLTVQPYKMKQ